MNHLRSNYIPGYSFAGFISIGAIMLLMLMTVLMTCPKPDLDKPQFRRVLVALDVDFSVIGNMEPCVGPDECGRVECNLFNRSDAEWVAHTLAVDGVCDVPSDCHPDEYLWFRYFYFLLIPAIIYAAMIILEVLLWNGNVSIASMKIVYGIYVSTCVSMAICCLIFCVVLSNMDDFRSIFPTAMILILQPFGLVFNPTVYDIN